MQTCDELQRFVEADPIIGALISSDETAVRAQQTIGVAVKLEMAKLGWRGTGRKGVVTATTNIAHLERFVEAKHWADI